MPLYAGIDAGGTSTRCVVADEHGVIRGLGRAGPGNALISGRDDALRAIREAVRGALATAKGPLAHLHLAIAGTVVPVGLDDLALTCTASNDAPAALAGALVEGPGLIVIAGTGSAFYGQAPDGRELLLGGWGPLAGDEGSAYAIGRTALQHLTWALDRRHPGDLLSAALLTHLGASDRRTLLDRIYDPPMPREAVAALAGVVAEAAGQGDRAARAVLAGAGDDLARAAATLASLLDLSTGACRVATLGGVFAAGPLILAPFRRRLRHLVPGARVVPARFPPVIGALLLAYRHAGVHVDAALLTGLERTATLK